MDIFKAVGIAILTAVIIALIVAAFGGLFGPGETVLLILVSAIVGVLYYRRYARESR